MRFIIFIPALFLLSPIFGQDNSNQLNVPSTKSVQPSDTKVREKTNEFGLAEEVEVPAEFPGGDSALEKYVRDKVEPLAQKHTKEGHILISFFIGKGGIVEDVSIQKSISGLDSLNKGLIKIFQEMPQWKPAKTKGKKVRQHRYYPIILKGS